MIIPIGDENESSRTPWMNYILIGVNVAVFVYMVGLSDKELETFVKHYASYPAHFNLSQALTSTFLHGSWMHLIGNMVYQWIYGDNVEDKLGHVGYLIFYVAAGILASAAHAHAVPAAESKLPSLGASGAVSALLGAYAVIFPWAKIKYWVLLWFILIPYARVFYIWSWVTIGFWFLGQALAHSEAIQTHTLGGIAYAAHIGGFLVGALTAYALVLFGVIKAEWKNN